MYLNETNCLTFLQIISLTNDLLEREEQIVMFKKREAEFTKAIIEKDKMYEQDAMVRMQLGKRLEQVLMDKEDAVEQMDLLRVRIITLLIHNN